METKITKIKIADLPGKLEIEKTLYSLEVTCLRQKALVQEFNVCRGDLGRINLFYIFQYKMYWITCLKQKKQDAR